MILRHYAITPSLRCFRFRRFLRHTRFDDDISADADAACAMLFISPPAAFSSPRLIRCRDAADAFHLLRSLRHAADAVLLLSSSAEITDYGHC